MFNSVSNKKNKNFFTIGGKLLVYILFASSAVTTILTMGVFYFDYQEEKANLNEIEKNLRENTAVGIGEAVFLLNESAIKSQVDGLSNVVDIVEIKVTDEDKNLIYEVSKRKAIESDDVIEVKLVSGKEYENQFAGWMYATITYENMHARILKRVVVFFVTQFLKTLALSFVILLIIYCI